MNSAKSTSIFLETEILIIEEKEQFKPQSEEELNNRRKRDSFLYSS